MVQYKRTQHPLPEFSPRRQPGPVVFCMLALVLCATVWFCLLAGTTRAYGSEPLRFDPPPVDTAASRSQPGDSAATPPKGAVKAKGVEGRPGTKAEAPAPEAAPEAAPDSTGESPDTAQGTAASEKNEPNDDTKVVHLFNTADMFRKPIANNAPQWERVANEVKKKLFHSRPRA